MTDRTRAALETRLSAILARLDRMRAEDREQGPTFSAETLSYENLACGFSHAVNALQTMTPDQVRERVHDLEQTAENAASLVRPSWAYIRGASAAAILAQKMERTGA